MLFAKGQDAVSGASAVIEGQPNSSAERSILARARDAAESILGWVNGQNPKSMGKPAGEVTEKVTTWLDNQFGTNFFATPSDAPMGGVVTIQNPAPQFVSGVLSAIASDGGAGSSAVVSEKMWQADPPPDAGEGEGEELHHADPEGGADARAV